MNFFCKASTITAPQKYIAENLALIESLSARCSQAGESPVLRFSLHFS